MEIRYFPLMLLAACLLQAGCSTSDATPVEAARIVLVAHPGTAADMAGTSYAGEIRAREESLLSFRVGGKLIRRDVDVGAVVRKGQVLAVLDPGDFSAQARIAQAQLSAAEADLSRVQADHARLRALVEQQLVSRSAMDAQDAAMKAAQGRVASARASLDMARNQSNYTHLQSPEDGVIATRSAEAGQVVAAGQTVFSLAVDGSREVSIALPESTIREFGVGQPVQVELWSAPGRLLEGSIREIAPAADPQARTYAARISLSGDAARSVQLGQSARVHVAGKGNRANLSIPMSALQREAGKTMVWVVNPATRKLQSRPIQVGTYTENAVPVHSGLRPDDWVVVAGGHLLREGQAVLPVDRQNRPISAR